MIFNLPFTVPSSFDNCLTVEEQIIFLWMKKQEKLIAGQNITLTENEDGTVSISAEGGESETYSLQEIVDPETEEITGYKLIDSAGTQQGDTIPAQKEYRINTRYNDETGEFYGYGLFDSDGNQQGYTIPPAHSYMVSMDAEDASYRYYSLRDNNTGAQCGPQWRSPVGSSGGANVQFTLDWYNQEWTPETVNTFNTHRWVQGVIDYSTGEVVRQNIYGPPKEYEYGGNGFQYTINMRGTGALWKSFVFAASYPGTFNIGGIQFSSTTTLDMMIYSKIYAVDGGPVVEICKPFGKGGGSMPFNCTMLTDIENTSKVIYDNGNVIWKGFLSTDNEQGVETNRIEWSDLNKFENTLNDLYYEYEFRNDGVRDYERRFTFYGLLRLTHNADLEEYCKLCEFVISKQEDGNYKLTCLLLDGSLTFNNNDTMQFIAL